MYVCVYVFVYALNQSRIHGTYGVYMGDFSFRFSGRIDSRPLRWKVAASIGKHTPNLPTKIIPAKVSWLNIDGELPLDMRVPPRMRDKDLYTTTNKCLQCLIEIMYTAF